MRRKVWLILAVAAVSCFGLGLTACRNFPLFGEAGKEHTHSFSHYVYDENATCTADGTETSKCDKCNKTDTRTKEGTKLGHSFTKYVDDGNASCTEIGTETAKCDRCEEQDTRPKEGAKLGHSFTVQNKCARCETPWEYTEGLTFELIAGGTAYAVTGGPEEDTIVLPYGHNDLPVTAIKASAFENRESLKRVVIPEGVTEIGDSAFGYCMGLTELVLPDSIVNIGEHAFQCCIGLKGVVLPKNLKKLSASAFRESFGLMSVVLPAGLTSIGDEAFFGCNKLVEIWNYSSLKIKKGEERNGYVATFALQIYTDGEESKQVETADGYRFYEDGEECYLLGYYGTETELTLPSATPGGKSYALHDIALAYESIEKCVIAGGVTAIGSFAFAGCEGLAELVLGEGLVTIGKSAFDTCSSLTELVLPKSLKSIAASAFSPCSGLKSVTFEEPEGWEVFREASGAWAPLEAAALQVPATAATYLTDTYCSYEWKRGE